MRKLSRHSAVLLLAVTLQLLVISPASAMEDTFSFLTTEEVATRNAHISESGELDFTTLMQEDSISLKRNDGPTIAVNSPVGFELKSPIDFDVALQPRGEAGVDMGSLKIEYKLGPIWTNVTRRLTREARIIGNRLIAKNADLPAGNHALRVTVADAAQGTTTAIVTFTVVE
ncbi:hypothetical protein ACQ5SP_08395 [Rhodovulum sp. YNF3179]|uniref:hypothetical protein n=1 Tax=Rhodovulum sp. YNF3179 TaxID=3425127 RepID=UPI003D34FF83